MARFVAFLRAINVGGHTVTMARLRGLFESLGLAEVETFIASGNVIFTAGHARPDRLAARIAGHLEAELGYGVEVFLRTGADVAAIAHYPAFSQAEVAAAQAVYVGFLAEPLPRSDVGTVGGFRSAVDAFHVHGREIYWLCRSRTSESPFTYAKLERALRRPVTFRNRNTIDRLVARFGFTAPPGRR